MDELYIGLMSGTSLDGVDGVVVNFAGTDMSRLQVLAHAHHPLPTALKASLLALNSSGPDELHHAALAANALVAEYAHVVDRLIAQAQIERTSIRAVAAHGQTVRHRPQEFDGTGYTLQLNNPSLLAEMSGIDVIADFRSRDVAAGGQGAPLVPVFHRAVFATPGQSLAVLNLGGIANLTLIDANGEVLGFDCGPANVLLDLWCQQHRGSAYDAGGAWAATGTADAALLARLSSDPYFQLPPPKSTGRDLFNREWLDQMLGAHDADISAADVQATLAQLTVVGVAQHLQRYAPQTLQLLVCGGGAENRHLMQQLAIALTGFTINSTRARGLPPDQVESCAFAWLGKCFVERLPGNLMGATGAAGPRVLGALYPAR